MEGQVLIDTTQSVDPRSAVIGRASMTYFAPGIITSSYKLVAINNRLMVTDRSKMLRPFKIVSYDFSYMDEKNRFRTLNFAGDGLMEEVFQVVDRLEKGMSVYFYNIYADHLYGRARIRVCGATFMK